MESQETALDVNIRANKLKGIGTWRSLYLRFLERLDVDSILELGSGDPSFLASFPASVRRIGLDGNSSLADRYGAAGVEFGCFDFDREEPPIVLKDLDIAVCSDVFEHLLYPLRLLKLLADSLGPRGVLFSHVPNEFRLKKTKDIMLGRRDSVYFHKDTQEWNNPHLRRFTDRGYATFLEREFEFNLKITDLNYDAPARRLARLGLPVPYCLEGGPTYASTHDQEQYTQLRTDQGRSPKGQPLTTSR